MKDVLFYQNYVPTGDVISIALCIVVGLLMRSTYTMKRANLRIFTNCNRLTAIAATSNLVYHTLLKNMVVETVPFIYFFRAMAYILLVWTYVCFCIYIGNIVELEGKNLKVFRGLVLNAGVLFSLAQLVGPFIKIGFYIDDALKVHQNYYFDFFRLAYIYYSVTLFVLLLLHHKKVIRKVMQCLWCVLTLSFSIMVYQAFFLQTSYTVATFAVVIIALLFLFHYNAYDVETGTMDQYAFDEFLDDCREKNYSLISLSLPAISKDRMRKFSYDFLRKNGRYFRGSYCFRLRSNRIILVYQKEKNKNYKEILDKMFNDFIQIKERDKYDYYVTLMDDIEPFTFGSELIYFCEYLENHMHLNKIKFCTNDDIEAFYKFRELFNELKDIYLKEDLNDSRVKVYCQPVLNTKTNTFSTAEALMRLEIPGMGMIFPDQFIPVIEVQNFVHVFSKIILNKTCKAIKLLEKEGYDIERVSVNISVQELQVETFCDDVIQIIRDSGVDLTKIALELTESNNDRDYRNMEHVMNVLRAEGIRFYIDDFGTGYSNFERILGLPVDTIKFDRSLTILASKDEESKFMVGSFSEIFRRANYQVLFEGVEDEKDELQCMDMNAEYLQGYRYSRPIPIEKLGEFLEKKEC